MIPATDKNDIAIHPIMANDEVPQEITAVGLDDWFLSLNAIDRVKVKRYLPKIDEKDVSAFLNKLIANSIEDHNYSLAVTVGMYADSHENDPLVRFNIRNNIIDGLFGMGKYDDAKKICCANLDTYPHIREQFLEANNGILPDKIACRNRLIDILVGIEGSYDDAISLLDDFVDMGILDESELEYRKQSLRIHRMQKTFDNLFTYRLKE